jgi:rubredoxin
MAVCPECEAEIEYLLYSGQQSWSVRYLGGHIYEVDQEFAEFGDEQWCCPKCHKVLFKNECLADGFLRGKVIPAKVLGEGG